MTEPDILDEIIAERGPHFARLVDAAVERQQLVWRLVERRQAMNRTQTWVAAQMETSQSAIARLERGEIDPRLSTLQRYAMALGKRLDWSLEDVDVTVG